MMRPQRSLSCAIRSGRGSSRSSSGRSASDVTAKGGFRRRSCSSSTLRQPRRVQRPGREGPGVCSCPPSARPQHR